MKPASSTLTTRGTLVLGCALATMMLAIPLRDTAMLSLGIGMLLMLAVAAILAKLNLHRLELQLVLPTRAHAGKPFDLEIAISNRRRWLDSFHVTLKVHLQRSHCEPLFSPWVASQQTIIHTTKFTLPQRACVFDYTYEILSTFPLGLMQTRRMGRNDSLPPMVVYPRTLKPRELVASGSQHDISPHAGTTLGDSLGEPRGIRPWQPGDPAKKIHWSASARSLARGHGLRVRENEPPGFHPESCDILFHSYGKDGALLREDRFERALSLLAGTLKHYLQANVVCTLHADFLDWNPVPCESRVQFLEILALLAESQRAIGTEAHEIQQTLNKIPNHNQCLIISDIAPDHWAEQLELPSELVLVDIRQAKFSKQRTQHG